MSIFSQGPAIRAMFSLSTNYFLKFRLKYSTGMKKRPSSSNKEKLILKIATASKVSISFCRRLSDKPILGINYEFLFLSRGWQANLKSTRSMTSTLCKAALTIVQSKYVSSTRYLKYTNWFVWHKLFRRQLYSLRS